MIAKAGGQIVNVIPDEILKGLADLSGAKTLIGRYDEEKAKKYFNADILVKDGDILRLENTEIRFMETAGHTKGTISFFFDTQENGKTYRVGMFDRYHRYDVGRKA